MMTDLHIAFYV